MNALRSLHRTLLPAIPPLLLVTLLPLQAQRAEGKPGPPRSESASSTPRDVAGAGPNRELEQLERQLMELREKLDAQLAAGNEEAAASVKEEMARVRGELARTRAEARQRGVDHDGEPASRRPGSPEGVGGPRERREQEPPRREEVERRLHHLEIAIENLHAAGLHEPAERLVQQAERMRTRLREQSRPESGRPSDGRRHGQPDRPPGDGARERPRQEGRPREGGPGPDAMAPLRQEIRRLHEEIQALQRRMDELSRERR